MNKNLKYCVCIVIVSVAVFLPSLTGEFLWDDELLIVHNPAVKSISNIPAAFAKPFFDQVIETPRITFYRPLVTTINTIQYMLFGLVPSWWHLFNLLVHAANAVLCYFFILRFTRAQREEAFLGAMVFAMHAVHTESVCFISGRTDLLAMLFILTSIFLFFSRSEKRTLTLIGSVFLFTLGLFTKELVLMTPVAIIAIDYVASEKITLRDWFRKHSPTLLLRLIPFLVIGAGYLFIRFFLVGGIRVPTYPTGHALTTWLVMPRVFFRYVLLTIVPVWLNCDYTAAFRAPKGPSFGGLGGFAFLLGFIILTLWLVKRKKEMSLGFLWFLIFLFPVLNIFPLGLWMAERFLYIPTLGFSILLAVGLKPVHERKNIKRILWGRALFLILWGALAFSRSFAWRDAQILWKDAVKKNPDNSQARVIYGQVLFSRGKYANAEKQLILADCLSDYAGLRAARTGPTTLYIQKLQTLLKIYTQTGRFEKAETLLQDLKKLSPESANILILDARLKLARGELAEAEDAFSKAREKNPHLLSARAGLMELNALRSMPPQTLLQLSQEAISVNPDYAPSYVYKGMALRSLGRDREAIDTFQNAIRLAPANPDGYLYLADLYESHIDDDQDTPFGLRGGAALKKAMIIYRRLLKRRPDNLGALNNLAILHARMGEKEKAEKLWRRVLEIAPDDPEARKNIRRLRMDTEDYME